jgi:23S rRNA pseudouridine1911/1915/1917 synthase
MVDICSKINILYKNKDFLVLEKPSGLLVQPTKYQLKNTLSEWLLNNFPEIREIGEISRPGIVHRLDREVSGLMVVAKSKEMYQALVNQFQEKKIEKKYAALVFNFPPKEKGTINYSLGRNKKGKIVVADYLKKIKNTKSAKTFYQVKEKFFYPQKISFLEIFPLTGRTNQIRVHLKAIGCPLVGDKKYKIKDLKLIPDFKIDRIFLHAYYLGFYDLKNKWRDFKINLPLDLENFLNKIREKNG